MAAAVRQTISIFSFDPAGEPEIRVFEDGSLMIVFKFMPPSWEEWLEIGHFDNFERKIEAAVNKPVIREDGNVFRIATSDNDTVEKLRTFLERYRRNTPSLDPGPQWSVKFVKELLFGAVTPILTEHNFQFKKSKNTFVRRIPAGRQSLLIWTPSYGKFIHDTEIHIEPVLYVRLDEVEQLLIASGISSAPGETLRAEVEWLAFGPGSDRFFRLTWTVKNERAVQKAIKALSEMVQLEIIPFFAQYQDVERFDKLLNSEPPATSITRENMRIILSSAYHDYSAVISITLAHLASNKNFDGLVDRYSKELSGGRREEFDRLVESLRQQR